MKKKNVSVQRRFWNAFAKPEICRMSNYPEKENKSENKEEKQKNAENERDF
jgi:hypothetical protein